MPDQWTHPGTDRRIHSGGSKAAIVVPSIGRSIPDRPIVLLTLVSVGRIRIDGLTLVPIDGHTLVPIDGLTLVVAKPQ